MDDTGAMHFNAFRKKLASEHPGRILKPTRKISEILEQTQRRAAVPFQSHLLLSQHDPMLVKSLA